MESVSESSRGSSESISSDSVTKYSCVFCNQHFTSKTLLQEHFRLHANKEIDIKGRPRVKHGSAVRKKQDTKQVCSNENTDGNLEKDLESSVNSSAKSGSISCDVCEEVFWTVSQAISHKFRKHPHSAMKYYCPYCGMQFPIKVNYERHLTTHTPNGSEKELRCIICFAVFYSEGAKKFHINSTHKRVLQLVNPVETPAPSLKIVVNNAGEANSVYYCHLCGCEYQLKYNLQKHLLSTHTEKERRTVPSEMMQCDKCKAVFYRKKAFDTHAMHHQDSDIYATSEEVRLQVVQRVDQDFDHRRVPSVVEKYLSASAVSELRSFTWHSKWSADKQTKELDQVSDSDSLSSSTSNPVLTSAIVPDESESLSCYSGKEKRLNLLKNDPVDEENFVSVNPNCVMPSMRTLPVHDRENLQGIPMQCDSYLEDGSLESDRKITNTFYSSMVQVHKSPQGRQLHSYNVTSEGNSHTESDADELIVEKIVGVRKRNNRREFLVRWQNFEPADDTWEREEFLDCAGLIEEFLEGVAKNEGPKEWFEPRTKRHRRGTSKKNKNARTKKIVK